ncbi:MAG: hypothetical protein O3B37_11855 [Proteobacteria bacterium]|nr:hypothetical protein [Pseudomonadota bacterium]
MQTRFTLAAVAAFLFLSVAPVHADAIDGNWCNPAFGHLEILGPQIVTPGGNRISGAYDRHGFRHVVPAGEDRAGAEVDMVLVDDDTMHRLVAPGPDAKIEVWTRCQARVS